MPIYLLDKAYRVTNAGGVEACRVVTIGPNSGECMLPLAPNWPGILGVTVHGQPASGRSVGVRKNGVAEVVAAGPIRYGEPVIIADTKGKVCAAPSDGKGEKLNCLGFAETNATADGDVIEVFLSIHERLS